MLQNRYFLNWDETAAELGFDAEGLRQAMLVNLQGQADGTWLPVCFDSRGNDLLGRIDSGSLRIAEDFLVGEYDGRERDLTLIPKDVFGEGADSSVSRVIPLHAKVGDFSWDATHDHRTGWHGCVLLGGRMVLEPSAIRFACDEFGSLEGQSIAVAPREWCTNEFPEDLHFRLVRFGEFESRVPRHLYRDCFFYAADVLRTLEWIQESRQPGSADAPIPKPDWAYWGNFSLLPLDDAIVLSCDIEPRWHKDRKDIEMVRQRKTLAEVALASGTLRLIAPVNRTDYLGFHLISAADFRSWGESLPVPLEFPDGFSPASRPEPATVRRSIEQSYPAELRAAVDAFEAVYGHEGGKTPKAKLVDWLKKNRPELSNEAIARVAIIANWKPKGGAPKTPER